MGRRARGQFPQMRLHKRSGTARVRVNGREIHLGRWGSKEAHEKYSAVVSRLIRHEDLDVGCTPAQQPDPLGRPSPVSTDSSTGGSVEVSEPLSIGHGSLTVADICAAFLSHAEQTYVNPDGRPSSTLGNYKMGLRALRAYWDIPAEDFGPRLLQKLRDDLVHERGRRIGPDGSRLPKFRKTINRTIAAVCWIFKWAVSMELVAPSVYQALATVESLRKGRTTAPELPKVNAVSDEVIEKTIAQLPPIVADMVRVQRLLGCRPSELCGMRPCDIDRSKEVWAYCPPAHKNEWRGDERRIAIGPKAQGIIGKYLDRVATRPCFVPAESEAQRNTIRRRKRQSPMTPSHRTRRKNAKKRMDPNKPYTDDTYRRAVQRACERASVPTWSPNQLRHAAGEEARRHCGIDGAQARLGHKNVKITEVYAKDIQKKADDVAMLLG